MITPHLGPSYSPQVKFRSKQPQNRYEYPYLNDESLDLDVVEVYSIL